MSGYERSGRGPVVFYMDLGNVSRFYADIAKSPLPEPNGQCSIPLQYVHEETGIAI
jgi:hypothetical protein